MPACGLFYDNVLQFPFRINPASDQKTSDGRAMSALFFILFGNQRKTFR